MTYLKIGIYTLTFEDHKMASAVLDCLKYAKTCSVEHTDNDAHEEEEGLLKEIYELKSLTITLNVMEELSKL